MNWTEIKTYAWLVAAAVVGLGVQILIIPAPEAVLISARSEVTRADLEKRVAASLVESVSPDASATRPLVSVEPPTTRPTAEPLVVAREVVSSPAPKSEPQPASPWWPWWVPRYWSADNKATSMASPAARQTSPTFEVMTAADPVNAITGEMTLRFPVVKIAGCGLDFSFVLSYRSDFLYDGPVGNRWEHNWNARCYYTGSGSMTRYANNRVDAYYDPGSKLFTSPAGFAAEKYVTRYTVSSVNRIDRRLRDGTLEVYKELDSANEHHWYFLTEVQHRDANNTITLSYNATNQLTKLTDTRGKDIKVGYGADKRVSAIEDWSSGSKDRDWELSYTSGGDLTKINAEGRDTKFAYTGTSLLESITAPREVAAAGSYYLFNSYDAASPNPRVTQQRLGTGSQTFALSYATNVCTETDREGGKRIFLRNGTSTAVTKIRQETTAGTYADTSYEWDADALLTKVIHPAGNGVQFRYDGQKQVTASVQCIASGIGSTSNIATLRASDDFLVTEYSYYTTATNWYMVTKITDPIGSNWELNRDGTGNVTSYKTPAHSSDPYVIAYDGNSRVTTIDDPEGRRIGFLYGSSRTLTEVAINPSGSPTWSTTYSRDKFENITKVTDPEGRETTYARNTLGFVTKVTSDIGAETDYLYDLNDVVTETHEDVGISGLSERVRTYDRDIMDLVTRSIELSKTTTYAYDKNDRLTLMTPPNGTRTIGHAYDLRGLEVTRTVAGGTGDSAAESLAYDSNGHLITKKDGLTNATVLVYDGFDRLTKVIDPATHYQTTAYDKNGNAVTMERRGSNTTKFASQITEYSLNNVPTKRRKWSKQADLSTSIGGTDWIDTTLTYDKSDKLITKADPCGCGGSTDSVYFYDVGGRLTKMTDAATNDVTYALDKSGLVTKVTRAEKESGSTFTYVVEYKFDADKHLTEIVDKGSGSSTKRVALYDVDSIGRTTKVTDGNSNEVLYKYDTLGRVTAVWRGSGSYVKTETVYDLNDNVITESSVRAGPTLLSTVYYYDAADRMTQMKDEAGTAVKTLTYDAANNVVSNTDANSTAATLSYDVRNLLTKIDYTLGSNIVGPTQVKYGYDTLGRITSSVNKRTTSYDYWENKQYDARVERTWNTLSRIQTESTWITPANEDGSGETPHTVTYTYDSSGRVSLIDYPDNVGGNHTLVKRTYDSLNRVSTITRKDPGTGAFTSVATWQFLGPQRMTKLTFGNGVKETMSYDEYGRATGLWHDRPKTSLVRDNMYYFTRSYDAGDRVTKEKRMFFDNSGTTLTGLKDFGDIYVYDHQNRLETVVRSVGYATSHSPTTIDGATASTTDFLAKAFYTLDEGGNRTTLQYDVPGGPYGRENHAFDNENQLITRQADLYVGGSWVPQSTMTFAYDGNGNHLSTSPTVKLDAQNRIYESGDWRYRYDADGRRVEKRNTAGGYWRHCYFEGLNCVAEYDVTQSSNTISESGVAFVRIFGPYLVDQLLWAKICGVCDIRAFAQLDFLGSTVMFTLEHVANAAGGYDIAEQYRYDEYGTPYFYDITGAQTAASQVGQDHLYTGRVWDHELSLYYYRARYYNQATGRFLSRDPLVRPIDANIYAYTGNYPVDTIDPSGFQTRPTSPPSIYTMDEVDFGVTNDFTLCDPGGFLLWPDHIPGLLGPFSNTLAFPCKPPPPPISLPPPRPAPPYDLLSELQLLTAPSPPMGPPLPPVMGPPLPPVMGPPLPPLLPPTTLGPADPPTMGPPPAPSPAPISLPSPRPSEGPPLGPPTPPTIGPPPAPPLPPISLPPAPPRRVGTGEWGWPLKSEGRLEPLRNLSGKLK